MKDDVFTPSVFLPPIWCSPRQRASSTPTSSIPPQFYLNSRIIPNSIRTPWRKCKNSSRVSRRNFRSCKPVCATALPLHPHDTQHHITAIAQDLETSLIKPILDLEGFVDARQKLESQQQENQGVQDEFASLDEESNIYKLVGPVLLKQDKTEAVMAVNGRLEFIEKEMYDFDRLKNNNYNNH